MSSGETSPIVRRPLQRSSVWEQVQINSSPVPWWLGGLGVWGQGGAAGNELSLIRGPDPARSCQIVPDPKYRLGPPGSSRTLQDLPGTLQIDDFGHPENHQKIDASNFCILKQVLMISARFLIILSYFKSILGPLELIFRWFFQVPILLCFETNFLQISEKLKK